MVHNKFNFEKECMNCSIIEACLNIQIGGIPKASSVEHLVTMKTWMKLKEGTKEAGIIQTFDMEKFFDKESLVDTMFTLKTKADIDNKDYRLWYKLNENTRIRVKTSVGESDAVALLPLLIGGVVPIDDDQGSTFHLQGVPENKLFKPSQ